MECYTIILDGAPVGKGRPRYTRRGGGRMYTPAKTAAYERRIRQAWRETYPDWNPSEDSHTKRAYRLWIEAFYPVPKSANKTERKKMIAREIFPTKKPDLDNVIKSAMDGLNGVAYMDDSQIVSVMGYKAYDENPRLFITLQEVT